MRQLSFSSDTWIVRKDGDFTARSIFDNHYSRRRYKDGRTPAKFVGPGEYLVLLTPDALALFVWLKFIDDCSVPQTGINCAVFRNEGQQLSSGLIRAADEIAWNRWPQQPRHYTYIDPNKTRRKRDPGRCFLRAGWQHAGWTKGGLRILEIERGGTA